jgi:hypothetical protein
MSRDEIKWDSVKYLIIISSWNRASYFLMWWFIKLIIASSISIIELDKVNQSLVLWGVRRESVRYLVEFMKEFLKFQLKAHCSSWLRTNEITNFWVFLGLKEFDFELQQFKIRAWTYFWTQQDKWVLAQC